MNDTEMLNFFKLKDNPFKLEVILETFVGYNLERTKLLNLKDMICYIAPSSSGLGCRVLVPETGVRIPAGLFLN